MAAAVVGLAGEEGELLAVVEADEDVGAATMVQYSAYSTVR